MNAIVKIDLQQLATDYGYTKSQLDLVRLVAAKDCTDEEVAQLLALAHVTGLNPLQKQLYMVRRYDNQSGRHVATPQTGIDGFRSVADSTERYAPSREPSYVYDDNGFLWSATAYVKKLAGGVWHEVPATAHYAEYVQTKKNGDPNSFWARMPHVMLAKCAESLALRRAFPNKLSGLYTHEEMSQADSPEIVVEATYKPLDENNVAVVEKASNAPQSPPYASKSQIKRFHDLGKAHYGDDWATEGTELLVSVSEGRTDNTAHIYESELQSAIDCLVNLLEQEPAPDMA